MLQVKNLTRKYPSAEFDIIALNSVSFQVEKNEVIAITGASGSGKSTLLGLLAGLDRPTSGSIEVQGTDLAELSEDALALWRGSNLGYVFQNYQLISSLTALENVALPAELASDNDAYEKARKLLESVGISHRLNNYPGQLSGGEQQRVAIARALIRKPEIILADEPTGNLDSVSGDAILNLLFAVRKSATLIMVTHNPKIAELADREIILKDGKILREIIHRKKAAPRKKKKPAVNKTGKK
ncbi:MAG: ABC transporter ATP-binding protein [Leptospiraceae bacterium]|nr:ABC transporter ATP-binding protein [Leptospiraceae bacterium]